MSHATALEVHGGEDHVLHARLKIVPARGGHGLRPCIQELERHREIVRCQGLEGVLLLPDDPEVHALAVQVVDLAQVAGADQVLDVTESRVVEQEMPDHEDEPPLLSQGDEVLGLPGRLGHGLLHENVLPGQQGLARHGVVLRGLGGHHDGFHVVGGRDVLEAGRGLDARILPGHTGQDVFPCVARHEHRRPRQ